MSECLRCSQLGNSGPFCHQSLVQKAQQFLDLFAQECSEPTYDFYTRLYQVCIEIERTGTYTHTTQELAFGARVAWRNASRCIGRLHWSSLHVIDQRMASTVDDIFHALVTHIEQATNGGKIRSMATIFAPQEPRARGIHIWNTQLIRYAGYVQDDGSVLGDPEQGAFTQIVEHLGWKPQGDQRTAFDVLPLVIQTSGHDPCLFELPQTSVLEVPLSHPEHIWFATLGLKWHALPVISNMRLEIGGLSYPVAFNGWYMGTEIGRNLGDQHRYNLLPTIAQKLGCNTQTTRTLWMDQALVVLNQAILYSFQKQGVTIVDHHRASTQFVSFLHQEQKCGREVPCDWGWLVPPLSASLSPLFYLELSNKHLMPNFLPHHSLDPIELFVNTRATS
jgi:nitric-oxide synthase, bacterial